MKFKKHVFICTNERTDGRESCGFEHGMELVEKMKQLISDRGLKSDIRINKAGCLDACAYGPSIVVYPEAVWYGNVKVGDIQEIVDSHLVNNKPVERLRIDFSMLAKKWKSLTEDQASAQ